jgi:hypothetical protein
MTSKPLLQKILKGMLHTEEDKCTHENTGKKMNHMRQVDNQMRTKEESNTIRTRK